MFYIDGDQGFSIAGGHGSMKPHAHLAKYVAEVQADGDELEIIMARFPYLKDRVPTAQRVVRWFGDEAKFLVANS